MIVLVCFFFQAEDGIRDLVRSRGLGDVYKRQGFGDPLRIRGEVDDFGGEARGIERQGKRLFGAYAVSYTHLTLPTSDLV